LSKEFQVSRGVVRAALQQLAHEGFVQMNSFNGAQVVALTPEEVDDIVHLRLILEPEAVRLAMPRLTEADKADLGRMAQDVDSARNSNREFVHLDLEFHRKIWSLSGNGALERHLTLLSAPLFVTGRIMRERLNPSGLTEPAEHGPVVKEICQGRVEDAVEAMRAHIAANWQRSRAAIERFRSAEKPSRGRRGKVVAK